MMNKGKSMGRAKKSPEMKEKAPRVRDRSVKDRPENVGELVTAIEANRLDRRTRHAQRIINLRQAIGANPGQVARGMLADVLAINATIFHALAEEMSRPGFQVLMEDGSLNPILAKHWEGTQRAVQTAAVNLARIEADQKPIKGSSEGASTDISALILEASNDGDDKPS